ncbi:MAG: protein-glutamate O-methyltransferase CheR [Candidatus Krumholzibacteriales bacterium]
MEKLLEASCINDLILYVKSKTDLDLAKYRPTTLKRRISHRMMIKGFTDISEYTEYLCRDPMELIGLTEEITINVTEFFRDINVFNYLDCKIIPALIESKLRNSEPGLNVWSAGCSTGEEVYSMAMLLDKNIRGTGLEIRVLGTDISAESCRVARRGHYSSEQVFKIPYEYREKYINGIDGAFSISPRIRKLVSFRVHNLFTAPPVDKADMILCRNVIIHFRHNYREEILNNFHSALSKGGLLMLGRSEAMSGSTHGLFEIVSPTIKLYRKEEL